MATVASIVVTEHQVRQFLDDLLGKPITSKAAARAAVAHYGQGRAAAPAAAAPAAAAPAAAAPAAAAPAADYDTPTSPTAANPWILSPGTGFSSSSSSSTVLLRLHPRVDAVHPLGEAHTSAELEHALKLYRQIVKDSRFEVQEIMVGPDKAVITGHQIVTSHVTTLTQQLPLHAMPKQVQHVAHEFLPSWKAARVPTTVQLRFGKSDAGDPVVTQMAVNFSLPSVLLPHLGLQPWQQQTLRQAQSPLLHMLVTAGSLAATLEDIGTSLGATWRATAAVLQATVGTLFAEIRERMQSAAAAGAERAGSGDLNGVHG